ncbi:MAG: hypothetical protein IMF06_14790 [Proteobacteria bacterium]|nr:hypothetical protein [Pseudomonadota bacterium]
MRTLLVAVAAIILTACANGPVSEPASPPGTACTDPRPQVCTMEYNPVCATLAAGGSKQYASPCNACADDAVSAYLQGPCPVEE